MRTSPSIALVAAALSKAAGQLPDPEKDGKGNFGSYARLADFLPAVRRVLSGHGLAVVQSIELDTMTTTILHASGEWIATDYPVARDPMPQRQGSAVTYARRYSLMAALGLVGVDDDDDGHAASQPPPKRKPEAASKPKPEAEAAPAAKWSEGAQRAFFAELAGIARGLSYDDLARWCSAHNRPRPSVMPEAQRKALLTWLRDEGNQFTVVEWAAKNPAEEAA